MRTSISRSAKRSIMSFAILCVFATAAAIIPPQRHAQAADQPDASAVEDGSPAAVPADLSGRWMGETYRLAKAGSACSGTGCELTLDIVACKAGWCGIEVGKNDRCGATALRLQPGKPGDGNPMFEGKLELAEGTEPYVVQAFLQAPSEDRGTTLEIIGDTGGEFRVFRRSFPFHTNLVRAGDAHCHAEKSISMLGE